MCLVSFSKNKSYSSKSKLEEFKSESPRWLYIEITSSCSHKCAWCYGGFNEEHSDYMTVEEFKIVIEKAKAIGIQQITLSGGEPTEHPDFREILELASEGFIVNIATHGDWSEDYSELMKRLGVSQVQFNYQGSKHHDRQHGVKSYDKQIEAIKSVQAQGIDTVGTVTVGKYNLDNISDIFEELSNLGVTRLRVWEATGLGNKFKKDLEAKEIFNQCWIAATELGYNYTHSYDPEFIGNAGVPCLSLSKLFIYLSSKCEVIYCGAVPSMLDKPFANFLTDSAEDISKKYDNMIESMTCGTAYCAARGMKNIN